MIPKYINDWLTIIETMSNQNTYKLAWGRSILEYIEFLDINKDNEYIEFKLIYSAEIVLKYYWNQIFFFNLKQAPENSNSDIITIVNKLIDLYKKKTESALPKWFEDGKKVLSHTKEYNNALNKIATVLRNNPVKYFLNASINNTNKKTAIPIYERDDKNNRILIKTEDALLLKEYSIIISKLLNYKWTQLLEKYNFVPKISGKVTAISNGKLQRNSLVEYKKQLIKQFENGEIHDFYTGEVLSYNDATVDHVLPWSFMYSDDIWNLVLTSKSNNSKKSNIIPTPDIINLLKKRNDLIIDKVDEKYKNDLLLAKDNNYLDKYYYECKISH